MTVATVPYALQNASHSAALFRQSASAPFLIGGALSSVELLVTQQGSPNMSVILGPGRAKVTGTSVSPPAGQSWTTQAMYDVLNDAALTLTVAASNPTNPRIDLVYVQVQDSFYSGAANQAIAGVVTGTPAASPSVPATPANATAIATVAVGAGVTSIVNANIARVASSAVLVGSLYPTATATTLAALQTAGTLPNPSRVTVLSNGSEWYWNGTLFSLDNIPRVASSSGRDALFVAPVAVAESATVYRSDTNMMQTYDGTRWRYTTPGEVPVIATSVVNGTLSAAGSITFTAVTSLNVNGCFTSEFGNYLIVYDIRSKSTGADVTFRLRVGGVDDSSANYSYVRGFDSGTARTVVSAATATSSLCDIGGAASLTAPWIVADPVVAVPTKSTMVATGTSTSAQISLFHNVSSAFDGFTLTMPSGTMTGLIRIYGYNNN